MKIRKAIGSFPLKLNKITSAKKYNQLLSLAPVILSTTNQKATGTPVELQTRKYTVENKLQIQLILGS